MEITREAPKDTTYNQRLLNRTLATMLVLATSGVCMWGWGVSKEQPLEVSIST